MKREDLDFETETMENNRTTDWRVVFMRSRLGGKYYMIAD